MAKAVYGFVTMNESDIFLGLFLFSIVVSAFGAYVGILPGTDEETLAEINARAEYKNDVSMLTLSPYCPNCGEEVTGNFCANASTAASSACDINRISISPASVATRRG